MDVSYLYCPHGVRREHQFLCRQCNPQASWIRQWFMKKDDFTLWANAVILAIVSVKAALWLVGLLLMLIAYISAH